MTLHSLLCLLILSGCAHHAKQAARTDPRVTLAAVGDILLARGVGKEIARHGPDYPFAPTRNIISSADIAFFNLECPLSNGGVSRRRQFLFRADPKLASSISRAGFDVASLANNHTLDYGREAMVDTITAAKSAGMLPVGAGKDRPDAVAVRVIARKGLRIGFLAYTDIASIGVVRLDDRPTIAGVDLDSLPEEIGAAKRKCDVLVVSFHWGVEYMKHPTDRQVLIAHLAIDSGADLVLGHHPHVLQTVETYKGRPIIYSMGAFVWDPNLPDVDKSAIYEFELGKSSARLIRTVPIRIKACRPTLPAASSKARDRRTGPLTSRPAAASPRA